MKVCVLNGSPKGKYSVSLQTVLYLENRYPAAEFSVLHVGQRIKSYEKDMSEALREMEKADLLLFCYPVYTFIAPSQMHRFIELVKASGANLDGKYAAQITTSKHFYDVTAHGYIRENCLDLGLRYIGGLSADADDLLKPAGQKDALTFWAYVLHNFQNGLYESLPASGEPCARSYVAHFPEAAKKDGFDTVILTNREPDDAALAAMIADFEAVYPYRTRVINISEYPFDGGCLGCFSCAGDGKCVYKDGFDTFLREKIQTAKAIVFAFTIRDHSMGASFKLYDDRQFCNGHRTVTMGMPMGYLVNGDLAREANLQMIIEGRSEVGHNFLAGCATDADGIARMAARLTYALENRLVLPQNFYGVGGMKIFRDLIYLVQGLMKEDHRFYKKHGFYDFPQKQIRTRIKMQLLGGLATNPRIKAKMGNKMNEGMIAPYRKVIGK